MALFPSLRFELFMNGAMAANGLLELADAPLV
jgi:hypothetical protein